MSTIELHSSLFPSGQAETVTERRTRLERETIMIAQAEAEIDAGLGLTEVELEAWLDSLEDDENAPLPAIRSGDPADR